MKRTFSILLTLVSLNGCTVLGLFADHSLVPEIEDTRDTSLQNTQAGLPATYTKSLKTPFFSELGLKVDEAIYTLLTQGKPVEEIKQCKRVSANLTECVLIDPESANSTASEEDVAPPQHELHAIERQIQ